MEKIEIIKILSKWNFWGEGLEVGRERKEYLTKIVNFLEGVNKVIGLYGVRRSGKSFILRQVAKTLSEKYGKENVLYVNFEETDFEESKTTKLLTKIYEAFKEIIKPKGKPIVILDEIQEIKDWERWVRSYHERDECKIIVTGSSAKLMSEELETLLAGRSILIEVFPLSFKEFLEFKNISTEEAFLKEKTLKEALGEFLEYGSFPEVVIEENFQKKREILKNYYETILIRDVIKRFRIRSMDEIYSLSRFLVSNISSIASFRKISKELKIPLKTVQRFSYYLTSSRMLFFIKRFSFKVREQERALKKVYSIDTGIPNSMGFKFLENYGKLIENLVAINLISKFKRPFGEVYYLKVNDKEVDFVIKEGLNIKQLIQVTYASGKDEIEEREKKALIKAYELFKKDKPELLILTWDYEDTLKENNSEIKCIPLWKWLLNF